ncbi:unnamed protein product [Caenorhabditis auriculariae]|uniref:Domain of unknown function DX domain-containing protein n=1 Tax=Caenorhabditis auriculariae TaxID=2777116 RepID=A0A8S1HLT5_9PELO|nr:unnamed protein product [Caenorhabditis auriculariae]
MKAVVLWLLIAIQIAGAQKDYPATFRNWVGKADAEISAVEPSKGCTTNGECGQNQFCDFVFANGKKEQRQRCFNVPAIVGEVKIGAATEKGLKLCSSLKDCDEPDACYPLAQEVHDPATNNLFKGVCSKIVVTEDPGEILGEPCEEPENCTVAQFRENKINYGVRGCKKFDANVFISQGRGVCLQAKLYCPSKLRAGQPNYDVYEICIVESEIIENSDVGTICCPIPLSDTVYWGDVGRSNKIPRGYEENNGTGRLCEKSKSCEADEFCDDSLNFFNGVGAKDDSGPNGAPLRFCYSVPFEEFITYENNEKKFCSKNRHCGRGAMCEEIALYENSPKPFIGFCVKDDGTAPAFESTTEQEPTTEQGPSEQEPPVQEPADSEKNDLTDTTVMDDEENHTATVIFASFSEFCFLIIISTLKMSTSLLLMIAIQMAGAINDGCPADYAPTLLRTCQDTSGSTCSGNDYFCQKNTCCAFRPSSSTFQQWLGSADEEVIAQEPLEECKKNGDCGNGQFCDMDVKAPEEKKSTKMNTK